MKILHLSDTHGCHRRLRDLPEADVLVHSGDLTMNGTIFSNAAILTSDYSTLNGPNLLDV